jgi:elongation factor P hydroxylase
MSHQTIYHHHHHNNEDLIEIFGQTFYHQYQTKLVKGNGEPIYLPADDTNLDNRIIFAHGFYASGLHEISHWLVAGTQRRKLEDFGYWYNPDGRTVAQQKTFESVEVKPQATEWSLCVAAGFDFNASCDNLDGEEEPDRMAFQHKVYQQVATFLESGFPKRTQQLINALSAYYQTTKPTSLEQFEFDGLNELEPCS